MSEVDSSFSQPVSIKEEQKEDGFELHSIPVRFHKSYISIGISDNASAGVKLSAVFSTTC